MDTSLAKWKNSFDVQCSDEDLIIALTHPSSKVVSPELRDYEQFETIGDAVLDVLMLEYILSKHPEATPSQLTKGRSNIVNNQILGMLGERLGLKSILRVHQSYTIVEKDLSNSLEAIFGAIYIDSGMDACSKFLDKIMDELTEILDEVSGGIDINAVATNPVGKLQEFTQQSNLELPVYDTIDKSGPDNDPTFHIKVSINFNGRIISKPGIGSSKKRAKEKAARSILDVLGI